MRRGADGEPSPGDLDPLRLLRRLLLLLFSLLPATTEEVTGAAAAAVLVESLAEEAVDPLEDPDDRLRSFFTFLPAMTCGS